MKNEDNLVSTRHLRRVYREGARVHRVLDDVNLDIRGGECVALLGRSGSGKSTLLNLLGGIDRPDDGTIFFDGSPLHCLPERDLTLFRRAHLGFVYQFFNLIPTLTVVENVRLPLELNGVRAHEIGLRVARELDRVGLGDRHPAFPDQLSGGEQQRVAIARALIHRPRLVLADEPTGNLDAETGQQILEMLADLSRQEGRALVIVTHSLAVAETADRILTLVDGRLTKAGTRIAW